MLRLLVFAPCEKVIIDDKGNASLIVLLQDIGVEIPAKATIPPTAVTPKEWAVFTVWRVEAEDVGKPFSQVVQLLWPDGKEFKRTAIPFTPTLEGKSHQNSMNIVGFPVGQVGTFTVNMWLETNSQKVGETYSYSLTVTHTAKA